MKRSPKIIMILSLALCFLILAAAAPPRQLSSADCRVMEQYLHHQGLEAIIDSGFLTTAGGEAMIILECRSPDGGITFPYVVPLGSLDERPALRPGFGN